MILLPLLNADLWTPTGGNFFVTTTDQTSNTWAYIVHSKQPLVYQPEHQVDAVALLDGVTAAYLSVGETLGEVKISTQIPMYLWVTSEVSEPVGPVMGDPSLLFQYFPMRGAVRLGFVQKFTLSLGAASWQLGEPGLSVDEGGTVQYTTGSLTLAANIGVHLAQSQAVAGRAAAYGTVARYRLGLGYAVPRSSLVVSLELASEHSGHIQSLVDLPTEGIVGLHYHGVSLGFAAGITPGVGVPGYRMILGWSSQNEPEGG